MFLKLSVCFFFKSGLLAFCLLVCFLEKERRTGIVWVGIWEKVGEGNRDQKALCESQPVVMHVFEAEAGGSL